jgi:cysteine sulfinate desulfinase/cysteine desulfurase-like protein
VRKAATASFIFLRSSSNADVITPVYLDNNATTPVDPAVSGRQLLQVCPGVLASNGSACHADSEAPSATLLALGFSRDQALGSVRLSLDATPRRRISGWRRTFSPMPGGRSVCRHARRSNNKE